MTSNYEEKPLSEPIMITSRQLDALRFMHERRVIDPLFFGHFGETDEQIKTRQAQIDATDAKFRKLLTDNFVVSNQMEE